MSQYKTKLESVQPLASGNLTSLLTESPSDNAAVAADLARRGFKVFPVRDWGDGDGFKPVARFPEKATTDRTQIAQWWSKWPDARVGLLTGAANGLTVIDVDVKNGKDGTASLADLGFPDIAEMTPCRVRTPSGGFHLFFNYAPGLKGTVGKLGEGLDIRNDRQFVLAPDSFKDDRRYMVEGLPLGATPLPDFPAALMPETKPERAPVEVIAKAMPFQCEWANEALTEKADRLAKLPEGSRQSVLNETAMWAGGAGAHGMLDQEIAREVLRAACETNGLPLSEFETTFERAWRDGQAKPIVDFPRAWGADDFDDLPALPEAQRPDWHLSAFPHDAEPDLSQDQLARDLGNAGWNRDARYIAELGGWHLWKKTHWEVSTGMKPMAIVRSYIGAKCDALEDWCERRAAQLDAPEADKLRKKTKGQIKTLRQEANLTAVERLARSNPASLSKVEQWDADDFKLGTPGGTVDLRTGELRPAERSDYITKQTRVAPAEPGSTPHTWLQFLAEVFPDEPEMPAFIQRLAGYALTGSTQEHRLFLFHGTGRNGKGTLLNTLQDIMGDYAKGIPTNTLLETRNPQHTSPIARLRGARLVRGAELPVGQVWNESLVKQMTGGDVITANFMRQDAFEFIPKFTLIVDANTKPRIRTTDPAMQARMTLIPFRTSFYKREDRGLPKRLKSEAPQILRWAIEGAVAWQREGLRIPEAVAAASREYLESEDTLAQFIADETHSDAGGKVPISQAYQAYLKWAEDEHVTAVSKRAFGDMMEERGFTRRKAAKGQRVFTGLRLRDVFEDGGPSDD
jgi:P4 family phage/plasmid primase-like protien